MKRKAQHKKPSDWNALKKALRHRTTILRREFSLLVKKHAGVATDYAVWRLQREGVLTRVRRGVYYIGERADSDLFTKDPIEAIASMFGKEVVFAYGTALYIHGLSRYGRLSEYYVLGSEDRKPMHLPDILVRSVESPVRDQIGIIQHKSGRSITQVTDVERTLIDCIHRPKYAQGWENVVHALHRARRVNARKIIDYVKLYRTPSLVAKVGFTLERFADKWRVAREDLESLRPYLPKTHVKFARKLGGRLDKSWNLLVPDGLLNE